MPTPTPRELTPPAVTLDELSQPSRDQVARLLAATAQIWKIKPWTQLNESQLFVVQSPADDQLYFVSAIGGGGEQAGIIVYRGADAYFGLIDFTQRAGNLPDLPALPDNMESAQEMMAQLVEQLSELQFDPMELLQLPQLQLMFEAKTEAADVDLEWIKKHKYKASGRGYPTFRAVESGYLPWWISADEADALALCLEQFIELCERPDFSPELLDVREATAGEPMHELLARVPTTSDAGATSWSDARMQVAPGELTRVEVAPDTEIVARIAALPPSREPVEMELLTMPTPLGDNENRPHFPSLLLMGQNGQIVGMEMIACGPGVHRLPLLIKALTKMLDGRLNKPVTIQYASPDLDILPAIAEKFGIKVQEVAELPTLDPAIEMLMEQMASMGDFDGNAEDDDDPEMMPRLPI